jgi:hypothetical protein
MYTVAFVKINIVIFLKHVVLLITIISIFSENMLRMHGIFNVYAIHGQGRQLTEMFPCHLLYIFCIY